MYDRLLALYVGHQIEAEGIDNAVKKHWITAEQAETIKATPRNEK